MKKTAILLFSTAFVLLSCGDIISPSSPKTTQPKDSIGRWLDNSYEETDSTKKTKLLEKAYAATTVLPDSSLKVKHLADISYQYLEVKNIPFFQKINAEALELGTVLQDSVGLADTYWNLGYYFSTTLYKKDSAYYYYFKAQQLYEGLGDNFFSARMLINMTINQTALKDYVGSEANTIKAIRLLKPLKKYNQLYSCYNNSGIIYNQLEDYDKALEYHKKALFYLKKSKRKNIFESQSLNNIGVVYKNQGDYKNAIAYYKKARLKNNTYNKDPEWEATFIDNIAYAQLKLGDTTALPELFYKALKIRDRLNDIFGVETNKLHLAEYYATYGDTTKALNYAYQVKNSAINSKYIKHLLESLLLLSKLEENPQKAVHLRSYIAIKDSLEKAERKQRNQFARIRFETDELVVEKEQLTKDKVVFKNWIGVLLVLVLCVGGFSVYYYLRQRRYRKRFTTLLEEKTAKKTTSNTKDSNPNNLDISEAVLQHIIEKLKTFVEKKQYLRNDISLNSLAKAMDTNPKYLSKVINFYKQKTFINYIKELRINYTIATLKKDRRFRNYTIKAIAKEVGFNSAESFSKAFHKQTGLYPSYFVKELEKVADRDKKKSTSLNSDF